jgi:membrane-associated phospholipid phosphatase
MKLRILLTLLTALTAMSGRRAAAQSVGRMLGDDLKNLGGDVWDVWTSPFRAHGSDWMLAAGTVGAAGAVSIWDDDVDRWMVSHRDASAWSALKELREGGYAFSGKTITPIAVGALVVSLAVKNQPVQDGLFGCTASWAAGTVVRNQIIYRAVSRRRPSPDRGEIEPPPARQGDQYDFDSPGRGDWGWKSIPAGHVANVLACASFLNHRFHMGYVEPVLYLVTAGVGVGRMVDRRHWTSDTVLGTVFGYAIGREVALRSSRRAGHRADSAAARTSGFYVTPGVVGTSLGWRSTF